jgi:hypothetical protein
MGEPINISLVFMVPSSWDAHLPYLGSFEHWYDTNDVGTVHQLSGEGNFGLSDGDLEHIMEWLIEQHVPFTAESDQKWDEYPAEYRVYDGYTLLCRTQDDHSGCMTREQWEGLWLEACRTDDGVAGLIDHFFNDAEFVDARFNTPIDEMSIDHLGAWPAPDPDEALSFDECENAGLDGTLRQIGAT